jgi:hypothetical protein
VKQGKIERYGEERVGTRTVSELTGTSGPILSSLNVFCTASSLKVGAGSFSGMLAYIYQTTWLHIVEDPLILIHFSK